MGSESRKHSLESYLSTTLIEMAVQDTETNAPNAPHGITSSAKSYNDWPLDAGVRQIFHPLWLFGSTNLLFKFETVHQETHSVELKVSGRIPAYAA